jgi:hypothetical protein
MVGSDSQEPVSVARSAAAKSSRPQTPGCFSYWARRASLSSRLSTRGPHSRRAAARHRQTPRQQPRLPHLELRHRRGRGGGRVERSLTQCRIQPRTRCQAAPSQVVRAEILVGDLLVGFLLREARWPGSTDRHGPERAAQRLVLRPPNCRFRAATDRGSGIESRQPASRSPARWPRRGRGWHAPAPLRCSCHPCQLAHEQGGGGPEGARPPGSAPVHSCRASSMARSTSARCASAGEPVKITGTTAN